jgi:glutathione synthase/RimK-type ligase-like ATP-grasp enzyme
VDLSDIATVWWRRPSEVDPAGVLNPTARRFAALEWRQLLGGLLRAAEVQWVNDPERDQAAHYKILQLATAARVALPVPDTLVTSSAAEVCSFVAQHGFVVYKTLTALPDAWRETRVLGLDEVRGLDRLALGPAIFQEYIPGVDVRAVIVDRAVFGFSIDARQTCYPFDYRMDLDRARVEAIKPPEDVLRALLALMASLGLKYGAADLRVGDDGRWVFLELNPVGEWLFLERRTGSSISSEIARLLSEEATRGGTDQQSGPALRA